MLQIIGLSLLAVTAGFSFVFQANVNASLRMALQSAAWAAFISYFGGTIVMAIVLVVYREPWLRWNLIAQSAWWSWTGGLFGAIYVVISIVLLPRVGAAAVVSLIVAGQMLASLLFDHFGLFGVASRPADWPRITGALLLVPSLPT
jgi:transporter family-2 protein